MQVDLKINDIDITYELRKCMKEVPYSFMNMYKKKNIT